MAGYSEVLTLIENHIATNWTSTKVAYTNVDALDYSNANRPKLSEGTSPYISVEVIFSESAVASVGEGSPIRTWGYLKVEFYTKLKEGAKTNQTNIDSMVNLFEYKELSYIKFKETSILRQYSDQGWYISPIMIRFYFNR